MDRCIENVIEFLVNQNQATVTLSQGRYITKVKKLIAKHPEECKIVAENKDGSICIHVPVEWIKIAPPRKVSAKQREASRKRMINSNPKHTTTVCKTV